MYEKKKNRHCGIESKAEKFKNVKIIIVTSKIVAVQHSYTLFSFNLTLKYLFDANIGPYFGEIHFYPDKHFLLHQITFLHVSDKIWHGL